MIEQLKGIDIFFVGYDPVSEHVLKHAPDLKLILSVRDGPEENIDLKACEKYGIPVLNSAGRCTCSVAELTFNLIMNMTRPVITISNAIRRDKWKKENYQDMRDIVEAGSYELYRKTLGIIGMGRNGRKLAEYANAFGMRIIGYDPFVDPEEMKALNVELKELNDVMSESDYISVLARVTKENHNLVDEEQINLMKRTAALVNTGRPQLMNYPALLKALKEDRIRMAALDVHKPEPFPEDSEYYDIPAEKLILTNHMAGFSKERGWHQYDIGMGNLTAYLSGTGILNNCTRDVQESENYSKRGALLYGINKK